MKIRIKGNSIRIRLSKPEVEKFMKSGDLEERTCFGNNILTYALQCINHGDSLTADFDGNKITVFVPATIIENWDANNTVGFEANLQVTDKESLHILLEKDFKCTDAATEDQADNYEHPHKTC